MQTIQDEKLIRDLELLRSNHTKKVNRCLRERLDLLHRANDNFKLRAAIIERCKRDVVWFCNTWITTYNPRAKPYSLLPFVLFPEQEQMLHWLEECYRTGKWGAVIKCRYTGASYITTMWMLHKLMFCDDFSGTIASNKADAVDKSNSSDSLFYKVMDMYKRLPIWMQPFDMDKSKTRMLIYNQSRNSALKGASGTEIGRGGRSSVALVDEAAHIEADDAMIAALSENTDCAIFVSTPKGVANQFFRLAHSSEVSQFYYRWTADPRRSYEWRQRQDAKLGKGIAKQELDCDFYAATGEAFINPEWIQSCINSHLVIEGMLNPSDVQAGLDVAGSGKNKTVLAIRNGSVVTDIRNIEMDGVTQDVLEVNRLIETEYKPKPIALCYDGDGIGNDVRGILNNLDRFPSYSIMEFRGGHRASSKYWDSHDATSDVFLSNRRAEAWYNLRHRIRCTHDHVHGIFKHKVEDLISIPDDEGLRQDLVKPSFRYKSGKMLLESKQDMIKKGLQSPDRADAVAYAFFQDYIMNW